MTTRRYCIAAQTPYLLTLTEIPLRASDALHLALATFARAASVASFDARLAAAARAVGLATYPHGGL